MMKQNYTKLAALTCSAIFGLSACSSGGGSDSTPNFAGTENHSTQNNNSRNNSNTDSSGNTNTPSSADSARRFTTQFNGSAITTTAKSLSASTANIHDVHSDDLNTLNIDGRQIQISNPNILSAGFATLEDSSAKSFTSGSNYTYSRFGAYTDKQTNKDYIYSFGSITPISGENAIPVTGTVFYSGDALVSVNNADFAPARSMFIVNFGTKGIIGSIRTGVQTNYTAHLMASITGSSFQGKVNNLTMQGNFYGPNAAELGGTFSGKDSTTNNTFIGSFGAKR